MEYKYTEEGDKVKIIYKINDTQHLVQKVFINSNKEELADFVIITGNLYDNPVISW